MATGKASINNKSNIGIVKLKPNTPLSIKRKLEAFFIKEKLFLGWTEKEDGIIVYDLNKAKVKLNRR